MNIDPKYEKLSLALLLILLLGFIATVTGRLIPVVYKGIDLGNVHYISKIWAVVFAVLRLLMNIGISVWLYSLAAKHGRPRWTYATLGLFGGLMAPILYFLLPIWHSFSKMESIERES